MPRSSHDEDYVPRESQPTTARTTVVGTVTTRTSAQSTASTAGTFFSATSDGAPRTDGTGRHLRVVEKLEGHFADVRLIIHKLDSVIGVTAQEATELLDPVADAIKQTVDRIEDQYAALETREVDALKRHSTVVARLKRSLCEEPIMEEVTAAGDSEEDGTEDHSPPQTTRQRAQALGYEADRLQVEAERRWKWLNRAAAAVQRANTARNRAMASARTDTSHLADLIARTSHTGTDPFTARRPSHRSEQEATAKPLVFDLPLEAAPQEEEEEEEEAHVEAITAAGLHQDLSLARIRRVVALAFRCIKKATATEEARINARVPTIFDHLWARVEREVQFASKLHGNAPSDGADDVARCSRRSFARLEVVVHGDEVKATRRRQLEDRLRELAAARSASPTVAAEQQLLTGDVEDLVCLLDAPVAPCDADHAVINAEEAFAMDQIALFLSARLCALSFDTTTLKAKCHRLTNDPNFEAPANWCTEVPKRFQQLLLSGNTLESGETNPVNVALAALRQEAATPTPPSPSGAPNEITPAITAEIELLEACLDDGYRERDAIAARVAFIEKVKPAWDQRVLLLAELRKYDALTSKERLLSRKPNQAAAIMRESKLRRQAEEQLPELERVIQEGLRSFAEEHPDVESCYGALKLGGVDLRREVYKYWPPAAPSSAYGSRASSPSRSRAPSVAPLQRAPSSSRHGRQSSAEPRSLVRKSPTPTRPPLNGARVTVSTPQRVPARSIGHKTPLGTRTAVSANATHRHTPVKPTTPVPGMKRSRSDMAPETQR